MSAPLLYAKYDPVTLRSTEIERDDSEGLLVITHSQNTKPIVESAKALASNFDPHVKREWTHVARVPMVVWQRWTRLGITKDPKKLNEMLDSRECRLFRTDDARRI
jgi:hypothetical protein